MKKKKKVEDQGEHEETVEINSVPLLVPPLADSDAEEDVAESIPSSTGPIRTVRLLSRLRLLGRLSKGCSF